MLVKYKMPHPASNYHRCSNRLHRLSAHSAEQATAGMQIDGTAVVVPFRLKFCWCIEYHITPQSPDSETTISLNANPVNPSSSSDRVV